MSTNDPIKALIASRGCVTVEEYMRLCLSDQALGYYATQQPIGQEGDFITAPEISQMFGELIGLWFFDIYCQQGRSYPFSLVELGPGRGTLADDMVRTVLSLRYPPDHLKLYLLEINPFFKKMQADRLLKYARKGNVHIEWISDLTELPDQPCFFLANEFFDALPIRQFIKDKDQWFERAVRMREEGELAFTKLATPSSASATFNQQFPDAQPGQIVETCPGLPIIVKDISKHINLLGGAALIIDYGYVQHRVGDTFQALSRHRFADVLVNPGKQDLTAHVNFGALQSLFQELSIPIFGPVEQGIFLKELGIEKRAEKLMTSHPQKGKALTLEVLRLTHPSYMGALFKVLGAVKKGTPAGFLSQMRESPN